MTAAAIPATPTTPGNRLDRPRSNGDRPAVVWTLSLVPALVGVAGMAAVVLGAVVSGVTDGGQGWPFTVIAALLAGATVIIGSSYGLYLALAILAIGTLAADGGPTTAELVALVASLLAVHEIVRFSLDARRPSRFGSGLVARYLTRTTAAGLILVGVTAAIDSLAPRAPTSQIWVPVGLAAAAIPLFALYGAERLDRWPVLDRASVRAALGGVVAGAVVAVAVLGAQTQSENRSDPGPVVESSDSTISAPATTVPEPERDEGGPGLALPAWTVGAAVALLALAIYLMLRRPEAIPQFDDQDIPAEDHSFELGVTGLADTEADLVNLDEDDLADLLGALQLDLATERDPARAVRFGYATIERRLSDLGVDRSETETEGEFLTRVVPSLGPAAEAMTTLTTLFEQARFGDDLIDESMRQGALAAVDGLIAATAATSAPSAESATSAGSTGGGEPPMGRS